MKPSFTRPYRVPADRILAWSLLLCLCCATGIMADAAEGADLTGKWVLNKELTASLQPKHKARKRKRRSGIHSSISVGGYGVPIPGSPSGSNPESHSKGTSKDPKVIYADELEIAVVDGNIIVTSRGIGTTQFKPGKDHGTRTTWTGKRLVSKYQTTQRTVSQEYVMKDDNLLLVTVRIKPNDGIRTVIKKAFQRPGKNPS